MKKQLLFLSLAAAALLAGCSKNESDTPVVDNTPATEISAKAVGSGSIDTKAPVDGNSLDGLTADVYALTTELSAETANLAKMFTEAYGRGTMTFDAAQYVGFDKGSLDGEDGGKSLLPQNPATPVYLYGFYPKGWTIGASAANGTVEALSMVFDGSKDLMSSYLVTADDVKIQYNSTPIADKGELVFKHLLTRYNIQVKAESADAATAWGSVKSVAIKDALTANNAVEFQKTDVVKYYKDNTKDAPAFFKLGGTPAAPTYTDTKYAAADFTSSQVLSNTVFNAFDNACYTMLAPVTVDADKATAEIILEVVTMDKDAAAGGKETKTEVKVSLDQSKFGNAPFSTRGYSVTITLNFRAGAIQAIATVEKWKDGGSQNEDIDGTEPVLPKIGDLKDGGIIFWVDAADPKKYKVVSVEQWSDKTWAASNSYVIGSGAQSDTDGKGNAAAIKAYFEANKSGTVTQSTFDAAFPAAAECYNYTGEDGNDAKGTWYLPAKNELQYLWCAYNGVAPISWASDVAVAAPADATAQGLFNQYLIDAGGSKFPGYGDFLSGTEDSNNTSNAWSVFLVTGYTKGVVKGSLYYVRCVKDL